MTLYEVAIYDPEATLLILPPTAVLAKDRDAAIAQAVSKFLNGALPTTAKVLVRPFAGG